MNRHDVTTLIAMCVDDGATESVWKYLSTASAGEGWSLRDKQLLLEGLAEVPESILIDASKPGSRAVDQAGLIGTLVTVHGKALMECEAALSNVAKYGGTTARMLIAREERTPRAVRIQALAGNPGHISWGSQPTVYDVGDIMGNLRLTMTEIETLGDSIEPAVLLNVLRQPIVSSEALRRVVKRSIWLHNKMLHEPAEITHEAMLHEPAEITHEAWTLLQDVPAELRNRRDLNDTSYVALGDLRRRWVSSAEWRAVLETVESGIGLNADRVATARKQVMDQGGLHDITAVIASSGALTEAEWDSLLERWGTETIHGTRDSRTLANFVKGLSRKQYVTLAGVDAGTRFPKLCELYDVFLDENDPDDLEDLWRVIPIGWFLRYADAYKNLVKLWITDLRGDGIDVAEALLLADQMSGATLSALKSILS